MIVRKRTVDGVTVITPAGDLDARSTDVEHTDILSILPERAEVLLDLSEVSHLTSSGLRTLLVFYRQGQCQQSEVALVGLSAELRNALFATGFLDFFRVVETVPEGIELLNREAGQKVSVDA